MIVLGGFRDTVCGTLIERRLIIGFTSAIFYLLELAQAVYTLRAAMVFAFRLHFFLRN